MNIDNLEQELFPEWEYKKAYCSTFVATAIIGAGALAAGAQIYGAHTAANAQTAASDKAQQTALGMYNTTRGDLAPFRAIGQDAGTRLTSRLGELTSPIELTQEWLEKTPGYQFSRTQGLKAVQNSAAARGLANSGAALKGAANFATGLADNTYKTQFDVANTNQSNAYNRLKSLVDVGENAAAQTGVLGEKAAYNTAQAQIGSGNAQAAAANATGSAIGNAANNISGYAAYRGLYGNSGPGGGNSNVGSPGGGGTNYEGGLGYG